jgi:hypothetical protein
MLLRITLHNLLNPPFNLFLHLNIVIKLLIHEIIKIDHSILHVSAKVWFELGVSGKVESLDVLELPKDEEEEAIDPLVQGAAAFPQGKQDNWVADIEDLAVTADSYSSLILRSRIQG